MIRRSPCEYYLKYLATHPDNYSDDVIKEKLLEMGLDIPSPECLAQVKRQTIPPVPFRPLDSEHFPSQHFLNMHRIHSLYFRDQDTRGALWILSTPRAKEFAEAMILISAPPPLIARALGRVCPGAQVGDGAVTRFRHYFWNMDLVDCTEARIILAKRSDPNDKTEQHFHRRDSRVIAANLPYNPLAAALSQLRMGITPTNINFADLMEKVRIVAGVKAYQYILEDDSFKVESAHHCVSIALAATDLIERSARPEELIREQFHSLNMQTEQLAIPHIKQLSDGQHTTDMQPIEIRREVVEVEE